PARTKRCTADTRMRVAHHFVVFGVVWLSFIGTRAPGSISYITFDPLGERYHKTGAKATPVPRFSEPACSYTSPCILFAPPRARCTKMCDNGSARRSRTILNSARRGRLFAKLFPGNGLHIQ